MKRRPRQRSAAPVAVRELNALRAELERRVSREAARWNANPEDVQRSVARLVLTLVEFLRKLFEKQALRRMEARTLTPEQTEALGLALMRLEETVMELAQRFKLDPAELNLDLGPLGRLK
ncbi:MAG TPA: gas vesicle protein K [Gemmatimonadales bacterium]|nr:gas vesicle protein K [Gemmatimonadales bacterium]